MPSAPPAPPFSLRVPTARDAAAWHRLFDDPAVMEFFAEPHPDLAGYRELAARQRRYAAELGFCLWTVLDGAAGPVGFAGAQPWRKEWGPAGEIEIGWRLGRTHWGKGYATAAARETLERLRAAGVRHVVAVVKEGNERSVAVTRRLGMRPAESYVSTVSGATAVCHRLDL
ncbi:GNAT family N-acetyltransferase [Streptomyces carminius]|uniref:GNAT family N-acetyltransferase n=1 Tax=Streptomyces carminius TaxID=2665496 RepID=A0A2M8LUA4_9ACTN|nr:GNAT family N-acetyltransferase [Streptomyces carminius]PJE95545.1 GNAT family N-acetyltransferase [Streptomyces carminius]